MSYGSAIHRIESYLRHRNNESYKRLCDLLDCDDGTEKMGKEIKRIQCIYNEVSFIEDSIHEIIREENADE